MKFFLVTTLTLFSLCLSAEIPESTLKEFPPMTEIFHPVSTNHPEAQKSFNRGLTYIFAFNHDIAFKEFEKASKLDPNLAMAYWGMALALGQNVNVDVTWENEIKAYGYIQQALKLAPHATKEEQGFINALATRYTNDPKVDLVSLRYKYHDAMKSLYSQYSEDLDLGAMYAESILDLDPWKWWTNDGKPQPGILEGIEVLESILERNPEHIGANHYYIHAVEESPFPERALMSAHRLTRLLLESGHLLHMPTHIFLITGDYEEALKTNQKAIIQDQTYIEKQGMGGSYPLHYLRHNAYVLTRTYMLMEDYPNAIKNALDLNRFLSPYFPHDHHLENFPTVPLQIYLYFKKWDEILQYEPLLKTPYINAFLHFARGTAFAEKNDLTKAKEELKLLQQEKGKLDSKEEISNNSISTIIEIADLLLQATLAEKNHNLQAQIELLNQAIHIQDRLNYDEPPAWFVPIRLHLGNVLLKEGKYREAEVAFKTALEKLRRNGRLLHGLYTSLKGQGRHVDAYWVEREMHAALKHAKHN